MTTDQTITAAIEIVHLVKRFGNFTAVDDLSLRVESGEIFGLLGPNGSGKTTTVNMVSGLSSPTSGEVHVMGYDLRTQTRQVRQVLGTVHQETALYEELFGLAEPGFPRGPIRPAGSSEEGPHRENAGTGAAFRPEGQPGEHVFGRDEAPPGAGTGAAARATVNLPG